MAASASVPRSVPRRIVGLPDGRLALAGLAGCAGVIHLVATVEHVGADWQLGLFFAVVGAAQLLAGWRIHRVPDDRRILVLAAGGSVVVALLWIWSRTTGVPFGPESGTVASVGVADTIATVQELVLALVVVSILRSRDARGSRVARALSSALGVRLTYALLSLTLMLAAVGGHEH